MEFFNHDGIPYDELITFNMASHNSFIARTILDYYIHTKQQNKCNNMKSLIQIYLICAIIFIYRLDKLFS